MNSFTDTTPSLKTQARHRSGPRAEVTEDRAIVVFSTLRVSGDIDLQEFAGWSYQKNFWAHIKKYLDHTKLH